MPDNQKSSHILNTSSNLLGLCFVVLTALKVQNLNAATFIDEVTAFAMVFFMASSFLSFLSIRSETERGVYYEKVADIIFLIGLTFMFLVTMMLTFDMMR